MRAPASIRFREGWSLEAAEVVCAGDGIAAGQVVDLLSSLVDSSLVVFQLCRRGRLLADKSLAPRYSLLETVRQYAASRLAESGDEEATRRTPPPPPPTPHSHLTWAERLQADLVLSNQIRLYDHFFVERRARQPEKWARLVDGGPGACSALAISRNPAPFWDTRGHLREGRASLRPRPRWQARMRPPCCEAGHWVKSGGIAVSAGRSCRAPLSFGRACCSLHARK